MDAGSTLARLLGVERRLSEFLARLANLAARLAIDEQTLAQLTSQAGSKGGGSTSSLVRVWVGTAIAGGSFGSPTSGNVTVAVRSGNGWTTTGGTSEEAYNCDTQGYPAGKAAWATRRNDGTLEMLVGDC